MSGGRRRGKNNSACVGASSISSGRPGGSSGFVNSRLNVRRRNHLPHLFCRHPSQRASKPGAPRLNIAGEDRPFPLACSSKQTAQKSEPHTVRRLHERRLETAAASDPLASYHACGPPLHTARDASRPPSQIPSMLPLLGSHRLARGSSPA
jgi:hypothetical protein